MAHSVTQETVIKNFRAVSDALLEIVIGEAYKALTSYQQWELKAAVREVVRFMHSTWCTTMDAEREAETLRRIDEAVAAAREAS